MESFKYLRLAALVIAFALILARAGAGKAMSDVEKKEHLVRLLANSVAMNFSTEVKTNGGENLVALNPWASAEVFFEVTHSMSPLTIFIDLTCYAKLQWTVSLMELADIENVWKTVEIDKPQGQTGPKVFLHVRNSYSNRISVALATYETSDSQVFELHSAPKGFYKIDMRSTAAVAQVVKVSVLVGGKLDLHIPVLPSDNQVSIAQITSDSFNLYWKPVEINDSTKDDEIRYCVAINIKKDTNHLCEIYDLMRRSPRSVVAFSCFGGPYKFHLGRTLNPSYALYVNLFAVNQFSNRSRHYRGLTLPKATHLKMTYLEIGSNVNLKINKKSVYHVVYFDVKNPGTLRLTYVACEGPVSVVIAKEGKVLKKFDFGRMKTHLIKFAHPGRYYVTITKKFPGSLRIRMHLSKGKRWGPYARLPKGISVKEWPMLRTCNSVTIAWIAGRGKQQFCLFIGRDSAKAFKQLQNVCFKPASDPGIRLVTCMEKRVRKGDNAVFPRTIKGLQPCTEYIFYIQVKRRRAHDTLLYKPLKVRTRCNNGCHF